MYSQVNVCMDQCIYGSVYLNANAYMGKYINGSMYLLTNIPECQYICRTTHPCVKASFQEHIPWAIHLMINVTTGQCAHVNLSMGQCICSHKLNFSLKLITNVHLKHDM